jgi:hypothetical protein
MKNIVNKHEHYTKIILKFGLFLVFLNICRIHFSFRTHLVSWIAAIAILYFLSSLNVIRRPPGLCSDRTFQVANRKSFLCLLLVFIVLICLIRVDLFGLPLENEYLVDTQLISAAILNFFNCNFQF